MSRPVGPGTPPVESRFRKGQSGNPKGRPKKARPQVASAFDIVLDRPLTVSQGGAERALNVEEALQLRTYQDAITGSRPARREVLKMIARREQYLAAKQDKQPYPKVERRIEIDPENADAALLILGVADQNPERQDPRFDGLQLLLEPWAVQAALRRRRGGQRPSQKHVSEIEGCTRDPKSLRWPRSTRE